MNARRYGLLLIGLMMSIGCGGSSSPTTPPIPQVVNAAVVTASASPNPIIAQDCTPTLCGSDYQFLATTTVKVAESAGLGGNIDFVHVTLRNDTTGIELPGAINYGADEIIKRAGGTNHVSARGSLSIQDVGAVYRLFANSRQCTMTIAIQFTDDKANRTNLVVTVPVV